MTNSSHVNGKKLSVKLVLASSSIFRLELLKQIGIVPDIIHAPMVDETSLNRENIHCYLKRISASKAMSCKDLYSGSVIIAADTVVNCSGRIIGKPSDESQATEFLKMFSGRRHRVCSSICFINPVGKIIQKHSTTIVKFRRMDKSLIESYVSTGEWQGKAGGYGIQGSASAFVEWLRGSLTNVVGLDTCIIHKLLYEYIL